MFKTGGSMVNNLCIGQVSSTFSIGFPLPASSVWFSSSIFTGFFRGFINAFSIQLTLVSSVFSTLSTYKTMGTVLNKLISKTGEL